MTTTNLIEVFSKRSFNAQITPGNFEIFDAQASAERSDYLPHNKLRIANRSACVIYIYLDSYVVGGVPDYILGADKILDEGVDQGVQFNQIYIVNADAAVNIAAEELIVRVATARNMASKVV